MSRKVEKIAAVVVEFVGLTRDAVVAEAKADNIRRNMFLAILDYCAGAKDRAEIDARMKTFNEETRECILAEYSDDVQDEYNSYTKREREQLAAACTKTHCAFDYVETLELVRRMQVAAVRASEGKKVAIYGLTHPEDIAAFREDKINATMLLALAKNADKPEGGNAEEDKPETEATTEFDLERFGRMLRSMMDGAHKRGFLVDAIDLAAQVVAEYAERAKSAKGGRKVARKAAARK